MYGRARVIALALLVTCASASCSQAEPGNGRMVVRSKSKKPNAAALMKYIGLPMPPATVELYEYDEGLDDMARVIMVMSEADWATMRTTPLLSAVPPERWNQLEALSLPSDYGRWQPRADPAIIAAQAKLPNAEYVTVGYSPAGPGRVRIYLFWSQT